MKMDWYSELPPPDAALAGRVVLLAAAPGQARRQRLRAWLQAARTGGARTWLLVADREESGPWAGLNAWLEALLPNLESRAPALVTRHDYELATVLPALRRRLRVRNPNLTDAAPEQELVRNYPADRAYRILHGLIDLLDEWHQRSGGGPWAVACDGFDGAGFLVQRFFTELVRRRGRQLQLTLLLAVTPDSGQAAASWCGPGAGAPAPDWLTGFPPGAVAAGARLAFPAAPAPAVPAEEWARRALALEAAVGRDPVAVESEAPRLVSYWQRAGEPQRALPWLARAFSTFTTRGMYADAAPYGEAALALLLSGAAAADPHRHWNLAGKLLSCYLPLGRVEEARRLLEATLAVSDDPELRFRASYMMAMLHARFLPRRDFALAEDWLERGLAEIGRAALAPAERVFHTVFNRNGLALVRHRQGRSAEAVALCREGYALLEQHLLPDQHRLHRSVLLFNIAQVYSAMGDHAAAIRYYTAAIAMDPNYSEYYNERGNLQLCLGQPLEALADYRRAIDLSPPYAEVWGNLGVCRLRLGQPAEAEAAFSACLDLEPTDRWALAGRAAARAELGQSDAALADYDAALALAPDEPAVLAGRAALHYSGGRAAAALADLDRAVALAPQSADLRFNRAAALTALGRPLAAVADLQAYLDLSPAAPDREAVAVKIAALRRQAGEG